MKARASVASVLLVLAACTAKEAAPPADTAAIAPAPAANADPDKNAVGDGAVPAGFVARTDRADAPISGAKYTRVGDKWEITTGPAHIIYSPATMGNGDYTASASMEQSGKPAHPEAFGIFIGGRDLDQPTQTYTYFIVRGTGEMAVKVREGEKTRDVVKWTTSADVPKQDASGNGKYDLAVQVAGNAVKFMVNGKQVGSVSKAGLPTDGIAGTRINHNLHVLTTPVSVKAP